MKVKTFCNLITVGTKQSDSLLQITSYSALQADCGSRRLFNNWYVFLPTIAKNAALRCSGAALF